MGFIEQMKWWQWTGLSLLLGALLAFLNTGINDTTVDHGSVSTVVFETDLISKPWVDPKNPGNQKAWMSDIVVHPVHEIKVGGQKIASQLVSFTQFTAPTPLHPSGEYAQQYLLAPFPYEPTPRASASNRNQAYPAASLYYGKAGDTLNSLAARFYHKDNQQGVKTIIYANPSLRQAKGPADLKIIPGRAYWIPWNPADQHTMSDFLLAANDFVKKQQGASAIPISFHYHWWEASKYGYQMWMVGSFLIVGVIWPTLLTVMLKGGFGRMKPEEYDLNRFKGAPQRPEPEKMPAASATESDMQKLRDLEISMAESLKGFVTAAPAAEVATEAAPEPVAEIKKLAGGPAEAVAPTQVQEEPKAYTGEFYPVVKSTGHADEKK